MKQQLKEKILENLKTLTEKDIVAEPVYKCVNDGMVCFNGMVAELVNGCKYDPENHRHAVEEEVWNRQFEEDQNWLIEEKRTELENVGLNSNEIDEAINRMLSDGAFDDIEPDIDYDQLDRLLSESLAEMITTDLSDIYDSNTTRSSIDNVHVAYCDDQIDFDVAVAEIEEIITNNE